MDIFKCSVQQMILPPSVKQHGKLTKGSNRGVRYQNAAGSADSLQEGGGQVAVDGDVLFSLPNEPQLVLRCLRPEKVRQNPLLIGNFEAQFHHLKLLKQMTSHNMNEGNLSLNKDKFN